MKQELHCSLCKHTLGSKYFFQNIRTVCWSFTGAFYSLFFLDIRFNCQRKQTGPGNWHWEYFLYFKSCFLTTTNTTTTSVTTRRDTRQDGSIKSRKTVKVRVNTLHEECSQWRLGLLSEAESSCCQFCSGEMFNFNNLGKAGNCKVATQEFLMNYKNRLILRIILIS